VVSDKFGIKVGEVRGIWEPIITHAEFQKGIEILKKHDLDKSRERRHFYLLKGLLWMNVENKPFKMAGSSPKTRLRMYSYYTTQSKPGGKDIHVQCADVDQQIPDWLNGIQVSQNRLSVIREEYRAQIAKFKEKDLEVQTNKIRAQLNELKTEEARLGRLYITGKISEEAYNQLRIEWQDNIRNTEARLIEAERNINTIMVDLDMALILLSKADILYERLDDKSKSRLLKILVKRIIINPDGEIINQELNSPFTYLRHIDEGLKNLQNSHVRDSEQVLLGAPKKRSRNGSFLV
jgi:hypothetical protein